MLNPSEYGQYAEDIEIFNSYHISVGTEEMIDKFYKAKIAYFENENPDTSMMMKFWFQNAHSGIKTDAGHLFSHDVERELTALLRKDV